MRYRSKQTRTVLFSRGNTIEEVKMRSAASVHSKFFSSLKQVEKRLKLESPTQHFNFSQPPPPNIDTETESLSTPIYLHIDEQQTPNTSTTTLQHSSEPPPAFLSSSSSQSLPIHQNPPQEHPRSSTNETEEGINDIELLMQLLDLSDIEQGRVRVEKEKICDDDEECCGCEGGFYDKIVGVKWPKCKKEMDRLEGWICYFCQNQNGGGCGEERTEPLRLAYLLLGKAAFDQLEGDDIRLGFPSTIQDFLKYDPPRE